jgi:hypothetical protein
MVGPAMLPQFGGFGEEGGELRQAMNGGHPANEPAPAPRKRVIRIHGLEGGVREIPFSQ